jgi:hypothetical protein
MVAFIAVLMSIMVLALSTLPQFQRHLTRCELEEMLSLDNQDEDFLTHISEADCDTPLTSTDFQNTSDMFDYYDYFANKTDDYMDYYMKFYDDMEVKQIEYREMINSHTVRVGWLAYVEYTVIVFFTAELALRLMSCPKVARYFLSVINIIDALALAFAYVDIILDEALRKEKFQTNVLDMLQYIQILRVLRLFRLVSNVTGYKVLTYSVRNSYKDLLVLLMYLVVAITLFGSIIYFSEGSKIVRNIPEGWWWAVITLTTVGYGDIYPVSALGKVVGACCAISGVVLLSVSIPVFVNTFMSLYNYAALYTKLSNKRSQAMAAEERKRKAEKEKNGKQEDLKQLPTVGNAWNS